MTNPLLFILRKDNQYIKDYQSNTNGKCFTAIETKENEICIDDNDICFLDFFERKIINRI